MFRGPVVGRSDAGGPKGRPWGPWLEASGRVGRSDGSRRGRAPEAAQAVVSFAFSRRGGKVLETFYLGLPSLLWPLW